MLKDNESEFDTLARELSAHLTDHTNDIIVEEYRLSKELRCMEVPSGVVQEENAKTGDAQLRSRIFALRSNRGPIKQCSHRRPIYGRTRIVRVDEVEEDGVFYLVLKCGCGHFFHHMSACRHLYCILDRQPTIDDVFPEKCKKYEADFHSDPVFKQQCLQRTLWLKKHGGIVVKGKLEDLQLNPR